MATAPTKSRAARELARRARNVRVPEPMQFVMFEDNGGAYHWMLVARDGATLARSGSFASSNDAEQAARRVRDGAAAARLDHRADNDVGSVDLTAHDDERTEDLDAERWLDERGSVSREAVTR